MGMFSRQGDAMPAAQGKGARFSFVGPEMNVTGDIATGGDLHVDGKIDEVARSAPAWGWSHRSSAALVRSVRRSFGA